MKKEAFSCPTHGDKPKWITADGKFLGPVKKHCKGLSELDSHPDDNETLTQSTEFKQRVFMSNSTTQSKNRGLFESHEGENKVFHFGHILLYIVWYMSRFE